MPQVFREKYQGDGQTDGRNSGMILPILVNEMSHVGENWSREAHYFVALY